MADWMSANNQGLSKKYKSAAKRVGDVERQLETVSKRRLAELLKQSKAHRLNAFDDADLLPNEKNELRKSILIDDTRPKRQALAWRPAALLRRQMLSVSFFLRGFYIAALVVPAGYVFNAAWSNTGQLIVASSSMTVDWRMPDGEILRRTVPAGESLVLLKRHDGSYVVRKWYALKGYATAKVNVATNQ